MRSSRKEGRAEFIAGRAARSTASRAPTRRRRRPGRAYPRPSARLFSAGAPALISLCGVEYVCAKWKSKQSIQSNSELPSVSISYLPETLAFANAALSVSAVCAPRLVFSDRNTDAWNGFDGWAGRSQKRTSGWHARGSKT